MGKHKHIERKYFYYMRGRDNHPLVTVCLLVSNPHISRGVAVCGLMDNPDKKVGRNRAEGRARRALASQELGDLINRPEAMLPCWIVGYRWWDDEWCFKSNPIPVLSDMEEELVMGMEVV